MSLTIALLLIFITAALIGSVVVPQALGRAVVYGEERQRKFSNNMEQILPRSEAARLSRLFILAPFAFGAAGYFFLPEEMRGAGIVMGVIAGFLFPGMYIRVLQEKVRNKFADQLVDALMIMSSSFRGGLSLVQAIEAVVDEMPDPINREFGIVLGENKMGVSLDEALKHLYNRMPSSALQQMNTAILLARETGGNLPYVFSRIVSTIRENKKIRENLRTLTIQGKIQGVVMSLLPIGFVLLVYSANKRVFEHMFHSEIGQGMLVYACISEVIGAIMIWKISSFKDF